MIARVRVFDPTASTYRGVLPTVGLQFSVEVGGGGGCSFDALKTDMDTLGAWDCVLLVDMFHAGDWQAVGIYALRGPFRREKVGGPLVSCTGVGLLEAWASETVILPEYSTGSIPRGAGTDRGLGWMMTAYNPDADPAEAWAGCYETSRSTYPTQSLTGPDPWPTGTGALWISITGATDTSERKLFRTAQASPLSIATAGPIRVFTASDSPGVLYIAGEPVIRVEGGEPGKEPILFQHADLYMEPGTYAVAFDTSSIWDTGGDGVDPFICAICTLDADADPDTWVLVTNETDWVACRRDDEPPGDQPPGPTPGALIVALVDEAKARNATGWANVLYGFDGDVDYNDVAWPGIVVERFVRYGMDTLWSVFQMLAETLEVDIWLTPSLRLRAAPRQGEDYDVALAPEHIASMSDTIGGHPGSWVAGLALDGWVEAFRGSPRREWGMELGTAISMPVATRILHAALEQDNRWDGSARLAPAAPVPLYDFYPGDVLALDYFDAPTEVRVLSISATAGEGTLLWDVELVAE